MARARAENLQIPPADPEDIFVAKAGRSVKMFKDKTLLEDDWLRALFRFARYDDDAFFLAMVKEHGPITIAGSNVNRKNAALPRTTITKAELIAFKEDFIKDKGTAHGWQKAACEKFLIDPTTLKSRLATLTPLS